MKVSPYSQLFICLVLSVVTVGWVHGTPQQLSKEQAQKTRPLPEVAADDKNFSGYHAAKAFAQAPSGHFGRTLYQSDGPPGYRVEVQDLSVASKKRVDSISLPGAAFLDVRSGSGIITVAEKKQELIVGSSFSVNQGQSFALEATSDYPLTVRVYLIAGH